jgi:hypothetical protein
MTQKIYPEYAMILTYDVRPGAHERYFRWVMGDFLPALQKRQVYMQNAWLVLYGPYPERHIEFVTEDRATLRRLLASHAWERLEDKLRSYTRNYSRRVIRYPGEFKL